jgi:hypothetical protein
MFSVLRIQGEYATGWMTVESMFNSSHEYEDFLFFVASRAALWHTQPLYNGNLGLFSREWSGRGTW